MLKLKDNYELVPLISRPEYGPKCIKLLNEEWPRSITQREISLKKSLNSTPPMAMIFLQKNEKEELLIGHARICLLPNEKNSCWIESIIIRKEKRNCGFGKILMHLLEKELKQREFKKICLSTEDKIEFYRKCGYDVCEPILNYGANSNLFSKFPSTKIFSKQNFETAIVKVETSKLINDSSIPSPPPLPQLSLNKNNKPTLNKTYMFKLLC